MPDRTNPFGDIKITMHFSEFLMGHDGVNMFVIRVPNIPADPPIGWKPEAIHLHTMMPKHLWSEMDTTLATDAINEAMNYLAGQMLEHQLEKGQPND